jgi:toxin ParE1/3/4
VKSITLHSEATAEITEAAHYYERRQEDLGLNFEEEVRAALDRIQKNPQLYPLYEEEEGFRKCLIHRFPYAIYSLELDDQIWIAAVAHQKRRPGYWRGRTPEDT